MTGISYRLVRAAVPTVGGTGRDSVVPQHPPGENLHCQEAAGHSLSKVICGSLQRICIIIIIIISHSGSAPWTECRNIKQHEALVFGNAPSDCVICHLIGIQAQLPGTMMSCAYPLVYAKHSIRPTTRCWQSKGLYIWERIALLAYFYY